MEQRLPLRPFTRPMDADFGARSKPHMVKKRQAREEEARQKDAPKSKYPFDGLLGHLSGFLVIWTLLEITGVDEVIVDKLYRISGRDRPAASVRELMEDIMRHDAFLANIIWIRDLVFAMDDEHV